MIVFKTMETSGSSASLFAGADVEADCLTFVEEIPRKEVQQIEVVNEFYTVTKSLNIE